MNKKAFLDTNVVIARSFPINSFHSKSKNVFNEYSEYYWSSTVVNEFDRRFFIKQKNLRNFYNDLMKYLENPQQDFYSAQDLKKFALKNYKDKLKDDARSSVQPFWDKYIGFESQILFNNVQNAISLCIKDLSIETNNNKSFLEKIMKLIPERINDYSKIDLMLKLHGVKDADRAVTIDGHEFAILNDDPIDFVSFDDDCYYGAKNVKLLSFNSIKGEYDFKAS